MELSLKRHPVFCHDAVSPRASGLGDTRGVRRKNPVRFLFQSTKWHFTDGFGKPVCMTGKTCDDDVTQRI
jgi:hypothetical protein